MGGIVFFECDNNLITNLIPDYVLFKKNISTFIEIPVDKIGCNLRLLHELSEIISVH